MGGFLSFSGFADNEIRGERGGSARAGYYYQLWRLGSTLGGDVVVGGWVEMGQLWTKSQSVSFDDVMLGYTLFLGADTMAGPFYLVMGSAEGGAYRFYLVLGRTL